MDIGRNKKILDLKKGFDTVDRKILLNKLDLYGIKGIAHTWIRSYLSQRTQYCQVNCRMSEPLTTLTGLHQSSVLGSRLFLLYINDLSKSIKSTQPEMFADDIQIMTSNDVNFVTETLKKDLENISNCMVVF